MKKHQLQTIAKIRKLLTDSLHTGWAMVETIKTNLDDTMSYEREIIMDDNRQMVQQIRIYDDATFDLRYLKCELQATLNGMGELHPELRDSALQAIAEIDYTDINQ